MGHLLDFLYVSSTGFLNHNSFCGGSQGMSIPTIFFPFLLMISYINFVGSLLLKINWHLKSHNNLRSFLFHFISLLLLYNAETIKINSCCSKTYKFLNSFDLFYLLSSSSFKILVKKLSNNIPSILTIFKILLYSLIISLAYRSFLNLKSRYPNYHIYL